MRRAVIVANSDLPHRDILAQWMRRADLVVAADGGANQLLALGIEPDVVVGDLDSILGSTRRRLKDRLLLRSDPNHTDLEKCLDYVASKNARDVTIFGASKGRLDHVHAAASLLLAWKDRLSIRLVDEDFVTTPVRGSAAFRAPIGTLVSLFSPTEAKGVTTQGLRWELKGRTLKRGTLGVHNQVVSNPVKVAFDSGELLLFRGQRVEPHS